MLDAPLIRGRMPVMSAPLFQPFPMIAGRRAQVWRHRPEFRRPRHFHEEPEINLVIKGSGLFGVGDRAMPVATGGLLLFQPGQDHVLLDTSDDFDLFVIALRPGLASRACGPLALASSLSWQLSAAELGAVTEQLSGLREVQDPATVELQLAEVFEKARSSATVSHALSRRALEHVRAEPSVSSAALAERFKTTPSGMSRRFRQDLGVTFVEYRSRWRFMRFVRLVDQGETFSRAALAADFGSYAQCHRVFQRVLGCSPSDYFAGARTRVDEANFESSTPLA